MAWETIYRDTWKRVEADRQIGLERTIYTGTSPDSSAAAALASTESSNAALAPIEWASISGTIPPGRRVIWGGKTWRKDFEKNPVAALKFQYEANHHGIQSLTTSPQDVTF